MAFMFDTIDHRIVTGNVFAARPDDRIEVGSEPFLIPPLSKEFAIEFNANAIFELSDFDVCP